MSRKHRLKALSVRDSVSPTSVRWDSLGWHHSLSMSNQLHMSAGCICMSTTTGQQAANQNSRKHFSHVPEQKGREAGGLCRKEFSWEWRKDEELDRWTLLSRISSPNKSNTNKTKAKSTHRTTAHDQDVLSSAVAVKTQNVACKWTANKFYITLKKCTLIVTDSDR